MRFGPLSTCRRCGQPMSFARLPGGNVMPVQPHPVPGGNVAVHRDRSDTLVARVLRADAPPVQPFEQATVHHRVLCPAEHPDHGHTPHQQMSLLDNEPIA